jgi:beta-N-acetylhexosaminidase
VATTTAQTAPTTTQLVETTTTTVDREQEALVSLVGVMTLEEKAAQVLLVGFDNDGAVPGRGILELLEVGPVGGVLLLGYNVESEQQLRDLISAMQEEAADGPSGIPLFVAVDQEGGPVQRIKDGVEPTPAARVLGRESSPEAARALAARVGADLAALGVNMNLAPVADVVSDPKSFLFQRTYSGDPREVAAFCEAVVVGYQEGSAGLDTSEEASPGVIACAKHFPGHGSAGGDTHEQDAVSKASSEDFAESHFVPFEAAIAAGVDAIMMAHIRAAVFDDRNPASLSVTVIEGILRGELGFDGLVISDDLEMAAAGSTDSATAFPPAVAALRAGCDLLVTTGVYRDQRAILAGIAEAVRAGDLDEARLDEAVLRILSLKIERGLLVLPV